MFTADELTRLAKACGAKPAAVVVQGIVDNQHWLSEGEIDTAPRIAEFLAQTCLETDYFRVLEEYASGVAYEGRKDLGNTYTGDGKKFKGRGIFQCTGRANYTTYGKRLGIDLLGNPDLAARPDISVRIAVMYWNDKGLNAYADRGETAAISRAINRGSAKATKPANHEDDRIKIAKLAREIIKPVTKQPIPNADVSPSVDQTVTKPTLAEELPTAEPFWPALWAAILSLFKGK